jgi:outer membrane protein assembly factor BamB
MMKLRILLVAAMAVSLSACFSKSTKPELKPAPLPVFKPVGHVGVLWSGSLSGQDDSMLTPAFNGGSVYAAGRKGDLVRFDAAGRQVWKVRTEPRLSGGVAINATRVALATSDGALMAYDAADGKNLWKVSVGGEVLADPLLTDDLVVVRIGDSQLAAYSLADGSRKWVYQRAQAPLALRNHSGLSVSGDLLFAGFPGGKLVALTVSGGVQRWEAAIAQPKGSNEIERLTDVVGEPVVRGDMVCVAAFQGRVACVDSRTGGLRWARDISSAAGLSADAVAVYVTDTVDAIYALDITTGATLWKQDKLTLRRVGRPVVIGDAVVVGDGMGYVHFLSGKDGSFLANYRVDSSGVRAPLLPLPNNAFAVQSVDGDVYALSLRR